ncbi:hypothetical protein ACMGDK_11530 [Chryseobacterium sp. DT-3]|uniref:hypothetical protein n=1 Tax=Chryseobacterium sp. DT-3 TaxID=3396164 RepID=UPI003F1D615A
MIPFSNNIIEAFYPDAKTTNVIAANNNLSAVIWSLGMCIQPVFFIITIRMKPYFWSYALPLFTSIYATSFYFLPLFGVTPKEDNWFFYSLIIIVILILVLIKGINLFFKASKAREDRFIKSFKAYFESGNHDKNNSYNG